MKGEVRRGRGIKVTFFQSFSKRMGGKRRGGLGNMREAREKVKGHGLDFSTNVLFWTEEYLTHPSPCLS